MLKFYNVCATTYHNDTKIGEKFVGRMLLDEAELAAQPTILNFTWENLEELYYEYGTAADFNVWKFNKGKLVSFFDYKHFNKDFKDVKQWKSPELNIRVEYEYLENKFISIQDALRWHEIDKAIRYLNERGFIYDRKDNS